MPKYWSGIGAEVIFTPDAVTNPITGEEQIGGGVQINGISNTDWDVAQSNRLAEVSNAQSGNHAKRIACLNDTDGSFNVVWDSLLNPATVGLVVGQTGVLSVYIGDSDNGKSQEIIIEKIDTKANVQQGAITYQVTYKGNGPITDF